MNDAPQPDPAASDGPATRVHPAGDPPSELALAEYDAGDPGDADAAIAAHVAGCAACQRILAALQSVRDDVRREFAPMPAAVSRQLAESLAAAVAPPGLSTVDKRGRHRAPEVVELAAARRVRGLRAAGAVAAGLIVLGAGGYLVLDQGHLGSGADSAVSAGDSGGDSLDGGGGTEEDAGGVDAELPVFDRQSLEAAADELLASSPLSAETGGGGGDSTGVDAGCLASLPVATGEALSVTRAVYEGEPALVLLFPGPPGLVQVTVLTDCAEAGEPQVLDQFTAER